MLQPSGRFLCWHSTWMPEKKKLVSGKAIINKQLKWPIYYTVLTLWQKQTLQVKAVTDLLHLETFLSQARVGRTFRSRRGTKNRQFMSSPGEMKASLLYCWPDWPSADESAGSCWAQSGSCLFPCDGHWPSHHLSSPAAGWLPDGRKVITLSETKISFIQSMSI